MTQERGERVGEPRAKREGARRSDERDHAEVKEARADRTSPLVGIEIFLFSGEALRGAKIKLTVIFRRLFLLLLRLSSFVH